MEARGRRHPADRARTRVAAVAVAVAMALALAAAGCASSSTSGGLAVGDLRTIVRRVSGGGAECPLSIPSSYLRPSTVAADSPVRADVANASHGAYGVVGSDLPDSALGKADGVKLTCRFRVGTVRVTLRVVGVKHGQAVAHLFTDLLAISKLPRSRGAAFVATLIDLPAGQARAVPGGGHAAYATVRGDRSSIALLLSASSASAAKGAAELPASTELARQAVRVAVLLGS